MGRKILVKENKRFKLSREKVATGHYLYFRLDKDDKDATHEKIYEQDQDGIVYFLNGDNFEKIILEGYDEIPDVLSDLGFGFDNRSINNFFRYKLEVKQKVLELSESKTSCVSKDRLIVNIDDLREIASSLNQEQRACEDTKRMLLGNFMHEHYPELKFKYKETNNNKDLVLRNLNAKLIEQLNADEIERFGKFYVDAAKKYKRADLVRRMLLSLQKNAQLLTLQEVIREYEALLEKNPLEKEWQDFFDQNITLFDNRYIKKLDHKNIATGVTKYPDLVLVDIYGYIDFYELKRSKTPLLQFDKSHKTYYWSKDMAMTISQATDYLQRAKANASSFANAIKEETATDDYEGLDVNIVNPRAIIVAGSSSELKNKKMRDQFKGLRESLKDVEFLLYDELLLRLKNLLNNVAVD